jgi:penicillin-binding protein 2
LYKYTLISKITDKDGNILQALAPVAENKIEELSSKSWDKITTGMENVILKYSATLKNAYSNIPVTVAGKTGTAQQGGLLQDVLGGVIPGEPDDLHDLVDGDMPIDGQVGIHLRFLPAIR